MWRIVGPWVRGVKGGGFYGDAGGNFGWDENLHLVERFSRFDAETLLYQFEVDNPTAFTRPWKGELMRGYRAAERKGVGAHRWRRADLTTVPPK